MRTVLKKVGIGVVLVIVVASLSTAYLLRDPSPVGYWRSTETHDRYDQSYARALEGLPTPLRTLDVPTSFGFVRVYEFRGRSARADLTPVVLLPGRSSGTPMWSRNLPELADARTVYAMDAIGDAGQSVQTRPITGADDQAAWIDEALDALHLDRVHLIGHSFGGWTAANYAHPPPGPVGVAVTARAGVRVRGPEMADVPRLAARVHSVPSGKLAPRHDDHHRRR